MPCQPTPQGWRSWSKGLKLQGQKKTGKDADAGHTLDGRHLCEQSRYIEDATGLPLTIDHVTMIDIGFSLKSKAPVGN